ncbi:MAG: Ig domain-containing protein group 2 domain-containing protein, partial [Oscillatoriales cyanobacterium]
NEPCGLPGFKPDTDVDKVNLYVSVFPQGKGLLPDDRWDGLNSAGDQDYNPNRVLTAEWNNGIWTWDGGTKAGSSEEFTLSNDRMLTAGQEYHWAVEAVTNGEERKVVTNQFKTLLPAPMTGSNTFSSVTVLTRGLESQPNLIDRQFEQMASHLTKENGLVMRYDLATNKWGWLNFDGSTTFSPPSHKFGAPLILIPGWEQSPEATAFNSGFTEAAADAFFASLVALNQNLVNTLFNSPMHFMGFGQGAAINNEIVQRLGSYFPFAGGTSLVNRDLQMTTIDPHAFDPNESVASLNSFRDPEVRIWENVTYADNYYQDVPAVDTQEINTPAGRRIAEADWNVHLGGSDDSIRIGFTENSTHRRPHQALTWYGGTANLSGSQIPSKNGEKIYRRLGDLELDSSGNPTTPTWYTPDHTNANFTHGEQRAPWEGIGTGWFYSVLGGGSQLRPYDANVSNRVPVTEDNTYTDEIIGNKMRGDYAVPTLFNGNFDASKRFTDQSVPGWSFYNSLSVSDNPNVSQRHLHERDEIDTFLTEEQRILNYGLAGKNYTLKMGGTDGPKEIIHNLFLVPDQNSLHDSLKFDLHVPQDQLGAGRKITVSMQANVAGYEQFTSIGTIDLERGVSGINSSPEDLDSNIRKIGYGTEGLETFYLNLPEELRGKAALLKFEINDGTVYLDDISFGKKWEPSMTLAEAEEYSVFHHGTNPDGAASIAGAGVNPARFTRGFLGIGFNVTNREERARDFSSDENGNPRVGPVLKILLNVKNPKVYQDLIEFDKEVANYGLETGLQEPERTVRYAEYLKSQGYDAISTTSTSMQHHLVFDPKQVVVVED